MDKTISAKNGSIRLTDDFIVIDIDKPLQSSYENIESITFDRPDIFKKGGLEIGLKQEKRILILFFGLSDEKIFQKVAEKIAEKSRVPLERTLSDNDTRTEAEKTSDIWLLMQHLLDPLLKITIFPIMIVILYFLIKLFG